MASKKTASETQMADILDGTDIPTAYKIGYILNFFREPSFRAIETDLGLTRPEIVLLLALNFRDGITAAEFCEFSGHLKAGVSRAVIQLEKKGYVERFPDASDNRRQRLHITHAGRGIYKSYAPRLIAREKAMLACLTSSERDQLARLLNKLAAHVPDWSSASEL